MAARSLSGLAAGIVLFAPTKAPVVGTELPTGKDVFGVAPRVLAAVGSGVPALVIIGGALWSVWRLARRRDRRCRRQRTPSSPAAGRSATC